MKRKHALLLVMLVLVTALTTGIFYARWNIIDIQRIPLDVTVDANFAFNFDPDGLHFGRVVPGGEMIRGFIINNTHDYTVLAELAVTGDIAQFISASETIIVVDAHDSRMVNLTVSIPGDAQFRKYTGELRVTFRRV